MPRPAYCHGFKEEAAPRARGIIGLCRRCDDKVFAAGMDRCLLFVSGPNGEERDTYRVKGINVWWWKNRWRAS